MGSLYRKKHWGRCFLYALLGYFMNTAPRPEGLVPCTQLHTSWLSSFVSTWTALLAPQSFPEKNVASTRLLRTGMAATRAPAPLKKRAMGLALALIKKIRWCGCIVGAGPQLQMQISSLTILWDRWWNARKDVVNMFWMILSYKQIPSVSQTRPSMS